jgi:DNA-binding transcriptional regulator GbsR (MarR family)
MSANPGNPGKPGGAPNAADSPELRDFVEALGVQLENQAGLPRMAGRVIGFLLVCEPPEPSAAELGQALGASAGSISTTTRMLVRVRLVERLRLPGERVDRFRIRPEAWAETMRQDEQMRAFRAVLRQGLDALADEPVERRRRLEEMDAIYAWWEERLPGLWQEYLEFRRRPTTGRKRR